MSGFSYPSWKGRFYPGEVKGDGFLGFYSQHLDCVEINSSFYAAPRAAMVESWADKTGEDFRFAFKAPRQITHILKLGNDSAEAADRFSKTLDLMDEKRGPVLFQLPPYAKQDLKLLDDFLSKTESIKGRVFEFRHESWFDDTTYRLLEKHGVGFCIAEGEDLRTVFKITAEFAYFRLRNEAYTEKDLGKWADKIRETVNGLQESYVFLRHDETGENAVLAQKLSKLVEQPKE